MILHQVQEDLSATDELLDEGLEFLAIQQRGRLFEQLGQAPGEIL